jgi:hypothetical protein
MTTLPKCNNQFLRKGLDLSKSSANIFSQPLMMVDSPSRSENKVLARMAQQESTFAGLSGFTPPDIFF